MQFTQKNFGLFGEFYPELAHYGQAANNALASDRNICLLNLGRIAETIVKHLCQHSNIPYKHSHDPVQALANAGIIGEDIRLKIDTLLEVRDDALRDDYDSDMACIRMFTTAYELCEWFVSRRKFDFLNGLLPAGASSSPLSEAAGLGSEAEESLYTWTRYSLLCLGNIGEFLCDFLGKKYAQEMEDYDRQSFKQADTSEKEEILKRNGIIGDEQKDILYKLRDARNRAVHQRESSSERAEQLIDEALQLCAWTFRKIAEAGDAVKGKIADVTSEGEISVDIGPLAGVVNSDEKPENTECESGDVYSFRIVSNPKDTAEPLYLSMKDADAKSEGTSGAEESRPVIAVSAGGNADFLRVCQIGNENEIIRALEGGADPSSKTMDGTTTLMLAAQHGKARVIDALIGRGVSPNARNISRHTALMFAVQNDNIYAVDALLNHNANVFALDCDGKTAMDYVVSAAPYGRKIAKKLKRKAETLFLELCKGNDESKIISAMNHNANPNAKTLNAKTTALMLLVSHHRAELIEMLLRRGARVNDKDSKGKTALMFAAESNTTEAVRTLLDYEADIYAEDGKGHDALYYAEKNPRTCHDAELLALLGKKQPAVDEPEGPVPETPEEPEALTQEQEAEASEALRMTLQRDILKICRAGSPEDLTQALEAGVSIDVTSKENATPLMFAAQSNTAEIVDMLITAGADLNAQDNSGSTALFYAAYRNTEDVVEALLAAGADKTITNNAGLSALDYARRNYRLEDTEALRKLEA
ncbi:MAG: ankyrin repeat domain-containing protein [Synergistaceae bacterium]|nr:ankyrin repeat domain-containing protein [Synergistaceae bacterium]